LRKGREAPARGGATFTPERRCRFRNVVVYAEALEMWWWWFVFWVVIIALLFSGGGWYGHRRSYYGAGIGYLFICIAVVWLFFAVAFAGPYWGYYGWWW
jgi:hypothetical protein